MIFRSLSPNRNHLSPKKAGIFDPYLDTLGGGERYCLTIAEALLNKGWKVDIFWKEDNGLREKLNHKFSLNINNVNFVNYSPRNSSITQRFIFERKYDFLFYFSDGSVPLMFGKKNILHLQVPFIKTNGGNLKNSLKLKTINNIVCNSVFTKKVVDRTYGVNSLVIYPPVDVDSFKFLKKENIILSVGRFSQLLQNKKQDILVKSFIQMIKENNGLKWKLILAGGSEVGAKEYLISLKSISERFPIEIIENPPFNRLVEIYGKAKIFWSASGFGADEQKEPEKVEHFGMTTVEAMAAGAVPVVLGKGGQKEIIQEGENGFLWETTEELILKTLNLIKRKDIIDKISEKVIGSSKIFSKENFYKKIYEII